MVDHALDAVTFWVDIGFAIVQSLLVGVFILLLVILNSDYD